MQRFRAGERGFSANIRGSERGFTLIELIMYVAVFTVVAVVFMAILITVMRIQVRQSAVTEVSRETQQLLQIIQRNVEQSLVIDMPVNTATSTLTLRMTSSSDPTAIFPSGTAMWIRQAALTPIQLTSNRVLVTTSTFVRRTNVGGKDTITVNFAISYNSNSPQQQYAATVDTAVARVTSARFDSNIVNALGSVRAIGGGSREWHSINNTIFFGTNTVGFGPGPFLPRARAQIEEGDLYIESPTAYVYANSGLGWCYRTNAAGAGGNLVVASTTCP
jgi:type II secretory pathway pseudopilin PulG